MVWAEFWGNLIAAGQAHCNGGFHITGLAMVALCYWGMPLQVSMAWVLLHVLKRDAMGFRRC